MPTAAPSAYSSPAWDEAFDPGGEVRPVARTALGAVGAHDLRALRALVHEETRAAGMSFNAEGREREFVVDPVPRVIDADEWAWLARGLEQRVRALDAFVADVHGPQRIIADGVMPGRVLGGADHSEPELAGLRPPGRRFIGVAGFDVVRGDDGVLTVLEDNLRTPSGIAFAVATRAALAATLPEEALAGVQPVEGVVDLLREALLAAVPDAAPDPGDPHVVLLTDGAGNSAHWEHAWLAQALGLPLARPDELQARGDRVLLGGRPVDVIYRRTDEDRGDSAVGKLLVPAMRKGTIGVVNPFGTGVADDKLTQAYVEDMVRFYLGQEPLIRSVPTYDLARALDLREALDRFEELVVKPRSGSGGRGVVINPHARPEDVETVRRAVISDPGAWVAQPMICLSTHPTVIDGRLQPRHVDLRPFVFGTAAGPRMAPAALTRVAFDPGALVVNTSQNGGGKDTWVPAE
ncbi:MAG: circularly permuted type 2 ATP-grasp protein [Solirubrobacteraceae bacterium]